MAQITQEATTVLRGQARPRLSSFRLRTTWLPVLPFLIYMSLFLLLPAIWLVVGAFEDNNGSLTFDNVRKLFGPPYLQAYQLSIKVSVVTALTGGVFGLFVAYAATKEGAPRWVRPIISTFSGVAANFAGIPLAFSFVATLGTTGVLTKFLSDHGINLYSGGFTLFGFTGLVLTYTYFQMPLMILLISPALDGLKREWQEAATNLGASHVEYWRYIALPILLPSLLGATVLLFGSAFSAYATAYALASSINLVPLLIGAVLNGNFIADPGLGDALAMGMIVIIAACMLVYGLLQRRANRWLR